MLAISDILSEVALVTGVPVSAITGRRRTRGVVWARFLAIAAIRENFTWWSWEEIAAATGRADHGSAIHAVQRYQFLLKTDPEFRSLDARVTANLQWGGVR